VLIWFTALLLLNACGNNEVLDQDVEICVNNIYDDGDGLVDCDDNDCLSEFDCLGVQGSEICDNNIDDDGDGLIDCDDNNCIGHPSCPDVNAEICNNNIDDERMDWLTVMTTTAKISSIVLQLLVG